MIADRTTIERLADLESAGIPPGTAVNSAVALLHAMTSDGRRSVVDAMTEGSAEDRRLVAVYATRGVVKAWHGVLGRPDWRARYDSRGSSS